MSNENKNWFQKHVDTIVVLGGILGATIWMTSQTHSIDNRLKVIETVLIIKNIMPKELCSNHEYFETRNDNKTSNF